jgi:hypothetical protein
VCEWNVVEEESAAGFKGRSQHRALNIILPLRSRLPILLALISIGTESCEGTNLRQAGLVLEADPELERCLHSYSPQGTSSV